MDISIKRFDQEQSEIRLVPLDAWHSMAQLHAQLHAQRGVATGSMAKYILSFAKQGNRGIELPSEMEHVDQNISL